ncbi:MAG: hypothetical protein P8N76_25895 [Pirellulaceae bacterium]|nr:hypothetical protein [Pirellulaceae bacterium]
MTIQKLDKLTLWFHGIKLNVNSNCPELLESLRRDFESFSKSNRPVEQTISITAQHGPFDPKQIRGWPFLRHLGGKASGWGNERWVDYGNALLFYNAAQRCGRVEAEDSNPLYHYTYYLIISTLGVTMDQMGLHRFHSLGVSYHGTSALFTMPISGGKSTLAMELLGDLDVLLISEDTPLIDLNSKVFPFGIRISLREIDKLSIPDDRFRIKNDPVFGKKYLLDMSHFGMSRCMHHAMSTHFIFWAEKSSLDEPEIVPVPSRKSLPDLLIAIGMGKDCPQRAEMVLRLNPAGIREIGVTLCKRLACAISLWRRVKCYRFLMTKDVEKNARFLKVFLAEHRTHD